jgi:quinol monooxygenase YgiN
VATISTENDVFTLINVFPVDPQNQQRVYDVIADATEIIKKLPGYVSANIHVSTDGKYVINYAQWRSEADFRAMHNRPEVQQHFDECRELSRPQPIFCRVAYTDEAQVKA